MIRDRQSSLNLNLAPVQKDYFSPENVQVVNYPKSLSGDGFTPPYTLHPTPYTHPQPATDGKDARSELNGLHSSRS